MVPKSLLDLPGFKIRQTFNISPNFILISLGLVARSFRKQQMLEAIVTNHDPLALNGLQSWVVQAGNFNFLCPTDRWRYVRLRRWRLDKVAKFSEIVNSDSEKGMTVGWSKPSPNYALWCCPTGDVPLLADFHRYWKLEGFKVGHWRKRIFRGRIRPFFISDGISIKNGTSPIGQHSFNYSKFNLGHQLRHVIIPSDV